MEEKITCKVVEPLKVDDRRIDPGDLVELSAVEAAEQAKAGRVEILDPQPTPAKPAVAKPATGKGK